MNHRKARRLLPQVLDGTLAAHLEAEVRQHAEDCRACRGALAEFDVCESLLAQLPISLVPLDEPEGRTDRLLALSRWIVDPEPSLGERVGMSALGAFAAAAMLVVVLTGGTWSPAPEDARTPITLAGVVPIPDTELMPMGRWR